MTELDVAIGQYRHPLAVTRFKCGITIDIHYSHLERHICLQCLQSTKHFITEMAPRPAV